MSEPRVSRTVVGIPWARSRSTNCCWTPGREAVHFDMDAVPPVGTGYGGPLADDFRQLLVFRHLPGNGDLLGGSTAPFQRLGGETRPEHDAAVGRVARSDAELERVVGKLWILEHAPHRP